MSQVIFTTVVEESGSKRRFEVMAGWDPPCNDFFMTIFNQTFGVDDDEVFWSTIDHPMKNPTSTVELRDKLLSLNITPPPGFWELVEAKEDGSVSSIHRWKKAESKWT